MTGNDGIVWVFLLLFCAFIFALGGSFGQFTQHNEWRECRALLTTQDSTAVLAARPVCAQWTWPPKEDTR